MKKAFFLAGFVILLCAIPIKNCFAGNFFYLETGLGSGTDYCGKFALNLITDDNSFFSIAYYYESHHASSVPADYTPGLVLFGDGIPTQEYHLICPMYGRVLYTNGSTRFLLKGGLALGHSITPVNFTHKTYSGWFSLGPSYTYDEEAKPMAGIALNPTIEFPISQVLGLSLGINSIICWPKSTFCFEANILLGKIRYKKRAM